MSKYDFHQGSTEALELLGGLWEQLRTHLTGDDWFTLTELIESKVLKLIQEMELCLK